MRMVFQKMKKTLKKPLGMSTPLWTPPRCLISNSFHTFPLIPRIVKSFSFCFLQIPNVVEDLFSSDQCSNITSKVLLFLIRICFPEQRIVVLDLSVNLCVSELAILGDAASCEGVCSERRRWKPSRARNYPRLDGWFSEVHKSSKCVRSKCLGFGAMLHYNPQIKIQTFIVPKIDFVWVRLLSSEWFANCFVVHCFSYREKAIQDAAAVSRHVEYLLQSVGKVSSCLIFGVFFKINVLYFT